MTVAQESENTPKPDWTLGQWLAWLEQAHPKAIDLGLERVREVAKRLQLLHPKAKIITVAGTNGKGSCVATLEALLLSANKNVGSYTSPHILYYNERIKINGQPVSDALICEAFTKVEAAREEISLTYFEFGTLAAFLIFQQAGLDYYALEVGLGGRLDAVNILDPNLAIITSIDLDHEEWLGDTREKISEEKLGILRNSIPCVCAEKDLTQTMRALFRLMNSELYLIDRDFKVQVEQQQCRVDLANTQAEIHFPDQGLSPLSVSAAIKALKVLKVLPEHEDVEKTLSHLALSGRFEKIQQEQKTYILDVAHNPAATEVLAKRLEQYGVRARHAVVGMMKDKNISEALQALIPYVDQWCVCDLNESPRAESKEQLAYSLVRLGVAKTKVKTYSSVARALEANAQEPNTQQQDTDLIFGSFITVSAAKKYLNPSDNHEK